VEASVNYPVQVGDRLLVSTGGRLEVVLPDTSRVRLGGDTDLRLERLASDETRDDRNSLALLQGQIVVSPQTGLSDPESFRLDTANASVLMASPGAYRVFTDGRSWTQVIVREGHALLVTERAETRLGPGQEAIVDGNVLPGPRSRRPPARTIWSSGAPLSKRRTNRSRPWCPTAGESSHHA
jgi:ferric-dicitrate binding protein FerR (iron transport regulator)